MWHRFAVCTNSEGVFRLYDVATLKWCIIICLKIFTFNHVLSWIETYLSIN